MPRSLACSAFIVALLTVLPATAGAAPSEPLQVFPGNPYYALLKTQTEPQVEYGARIAGCRIKPNTTCRRAKLSGTQLLGADLPYATLTGADLSYGSLADSILSFARLDRANLSGGDLVGSSLAYASLRKANLSGATITFAGLTDTDLRGARLVGTDGYFGAIVGSDLRGANMRRMDLSNSDVNGTDMRGANMREMDLTNADFTGSRMGGVNLKGAHFCNTLMPSGKVIAPRKGLCPGQIRPGPTGAEPIPVTVGSPLYPAISALQNGTQVQAGERVRGCRIEAFTKCRGAHLKGKSLQGGFLAYADLSGADLRGSTSSSVRSPLAPPPRPSSTALPLAPPRSSTPTCAERRCARSLWA